MPPQVVAPSPFAWPVLLGAAAAFFPALAALAAVAAGRPPRRLSHDPAGRIALAFAAVGTFNLLSLAQLLGYLPRSLPVTAASLVTAAFVIVPSLLAWIGGAPWHRRRDVLLGMAAAYALAVASLGTGRDFRIVAHPATSLLLAALALAAIFATVRRGDREDGRLWVAGGVATYYLIASVWRPLAETLFPTNPQAVVDLHMGVQLAYAGCMTAAAWGLAVRPPHDAGAGAIGAIAEGAVDAPPLGAAARRRATAS